MCSSPSPTSLFHFQTTNLLLHIISGMLPIFVHHLHPHLYSTSKLLIYCYTIHIISGMHFRINNIWFNLFFFVYTNIMATVLAKRPHDACVFYLPNIAYIHIFYKNCLCTLIGCYTVNWMNKLITLTKLIVLRFFSDKRTLHLNFVMHF